LRLVVAAPDPLPVEMVQSILYLSDRTIQLTIFEPLGSLLRVTQETISLFHKSLADWLSDRTRSGRYTIESSGGREIGKFLWKLFHSSNFNFFYSSLFAEQLFEWLPLFINQIEVNVSTDQLLDSYLADIHRANEGRGIFTSFVKARRNLFFAKSILKAIVERDYQWNPEPRLSTLVEHINSKGGIDGSFDRHAYGLLNFLCKVKHIDSDTLVQISSALLDNAPPHQPYYWFLNIELPGIYYLERQKPLIPAFEEGILAALYDGRVSTLNSLLPLYLEILEIDFGTDLAMVDSQIDNLADRMESQGDWDNWANKLRSLKKKLKEQNLNQKRTVSQEDTNSGN
jgi:hypothetical protein